MSKGLEQNQAHRKCLVRVCYCYFTEIYLESIDSVILSRIIQKQLWSLLHSNFLLQNSRVLHILLKA